MQTKLSIDQASTVATVWHTKRQIKPQIIISITVITIYENRSLTCGIIKIKYSMNEQMNLMNEYSY